MSDYSALKATINANIKANNNHEITGAITNSVLNAMVNSLGAGYQFIGVATPTNPGSAQTPDYKCFYLATTPGTYTNLGGLVVADGEVALLKYDTTWTKEVTGIASADKLNQLGQDIVITTMRGKIDFSRGTPFGNKKNVQIRFWANSSSAYVLCFKDTDWIDDAEYTGVQLGCYVKYTNEASESALYVGNKGQIEKKTLLQLNGSQVDYLRISLVGDIIDREFDFSLSPYEYVSTKGNGFDFSVEDDNENFALVVDDGNIRTKNFNSKYLKPLLPLFSKYVNKKISILGDSISTFGVPSASNEDGTYCTSYYPVETCRYSEDGVNSIQFDVEDTWWMKLIKAVGGVLGTNESIAGTTICNAINRPLSSQERISNLGSHGKPDLILVFGGTNDIGRDDLHIQIGTFDPTIPSDLTNLPNTTFADAVKAMCLRIMASYPESEIVSILPTYTTSYYRPEELDAFIEMMKTIYDFFGIKYIDSRIAGISIYNRDAYFVDGIHPNVKGMQKIYENVLKGLILN